MALGMMFPGQGSQSVGMLSELYAASAAVRNTFAEASDALETDLWALISDGPESELGRTENTQPAMLSAGVAVWRAWLEAGGAMPTMLAGHSLGEYSALVCAGAMPLAAAVRLARQRGRLMQAAVAEGEGAMAALLGLGDDAVRALAAEHAGNQVLEAVNFNAPGQVVVAGNRAAVQRLLDNAREAGARKAVLLPVSVPSHCALMHPAAEQLAVELESLDFQVPSIPVIHNATVDIAADAATIRAVLTRQLYSPVRWVESVERMATAGCGTLIECGPGKVLSGLARRIEKSLTTLAVFDPATLAQALEAVALE
ncbi:MAG: ACP S-malonyltransferase [Gammaproteobacteria bacterium]|nr:ACP S-malonyltransferase [Gammaproteobacteria bacterium]